VRTEANGGGDGADGGGWKRRSGWRQIEAATVRTEANGGGDSYGGGDPDGGGNPDGGVDGDPDASVECGRRDAGPVDRTGPGREVTSAQARRRLLQLAASYPHRLLRLASSRGDESRENEIEFCVREE
jgi:hypothetical protein